MRKKPAKIREIIPDAKYHDVLVTRFINYLMLNGKKSAIEKAVYGAFEMIEEKIKKNPVEIFHEAVEKVTPRVEVRSRRIGGATYQVPMEVPERRATALALKWLTFAVRKQSGKSLAQRIFKIIMDTLNNSGWAFKKKEEVFRMTEANKAFAHYNW